MWKGRMLWREFWGFLRYKILLLSQLPPQGSLSHPSIGTCVDNLFLNDDEPLVSKETKQFKDCAFLSLAIGEEMSLAIGEEIKKKPWNQSGKFRS